MSMAIKYAELQAMTREQLIDLYDRMTENTAVGLSFIRDELVRRDTEASNGQMLALTKQIKWFTVVVTVATIVNVVLFAYSLLKTP